MGDLPDPNAIQSSFLFISEHFNSPGGIILVLFLTNNSPNSWVLSLFSVKIEWTQTCVLKTYTISLQTS